MTAVRFLASSVKWAAIHFLACLLVVPATLKAGEAGFGIIVGALAFLTRVLYFPIMGLALYPRHWFPGHWIYVPIAFNSLLWGLTLAAAICIVRGLRHQKTQPDA